MRSTWILWMVVAALATALPAAALKEEQREKVRQQISSVKVWQLTRDLNLSEEQAQSFFPAQKAYEERKDALRRQRQAAEAELEELLNRRAEQKLITRQLEKLKSVDSESGTNELEYRKRLTRILSLEQQARYELFEKRFNAQLREMILDVQREDRRQDRAPGRDSLESRREGQGRESGSVKDQGRDRKAAEPPADRSEQDSRSKDKSKDDKAREQRPSREQGSSGTRSSRR